MSDGIKWAALLSGLLIIIAMIVALPLSGAIDPYSVSTGISVVVSICAKPLYFVRSLINNFLTETGRTILTGLLYYICFKWVFTTAWKSVIGIYKWIFK